MAYTTINKSTDYFNTKLYTGNGSTQSITGVGFQPDWLWIKGRSGTNDHILQDVVRGATKSLESNGTSAETTSSTRVTSFDSDGFSVGSAGTNNTNSSNYVSWNWKAGGTGVANTDGDINSTVSASTAAGFSIVKWTGNGSNSDQEIGTGLSEELKFVIAKPLDSGGGTGQWLIYVNGVTDAQNHCFLFTSGAITTSASGGTPNKGTTSGRLLLKAGSSSNANLNTNALNYIAYCFAEKKGYSKFGTYTGNENTDGSFVYTGFKPAFVLFKKNTGSAADWQLWDNKRDPFNPVEKAMHPNASGGASTDQDIDFLSNGFKLRSSASHLNANGVVFSYIAFGQSIVGSNNIPATAR